MTFDEWFESDLNPAPSWAKGVATRYKSDMHASWDAAGKQCKPVLCAECAWWQSARWCPVIEMNTISSFGCVRGESEA